MLFYIVVIEICLWHRYAAFEPPAAHVNAYPSGYTPAAPSAPLPYYCNNPALDWGLNLSAADEAATGGYSFGPNSSCIPFDIERDVVVTSSSVAFATYVRYKPVDKSQNWTQTFYIAHPEGAAINISEWLLLSFVRHNATKVSPNSRPLQSTRCLHLSSEAASATFAR